MQKYVYIIIDDVVRVMSFASNIIGLDRWIYISLVIKFSLKIGMGMDNPVTGLTIKWLQRNYCNFAFLSFKLSKMIIVLLNLWWSWMMIASRNIQYFRML